MTSIIVDDHPVQDTTFEEFIGVGVSPSTLFMSPSSIAAVRHVRKISRAEEDNEEGCYNFGDQQSPSPIFTPSPSRVSTNYTMKVMTSCYNDLPYTPSSSSRATPTNNNNFTIPSVPTQSFEDTRASTPTTTITLSLPEPPRTLSAVRALGAPVTLSGNRRSNNNERRLEYPDQQGNEAAYITNEEIHDDDVLCGRGGGTNSQIGNRRYRQLVQDSQPTYLKAKRKDKPLMAKQLVRVIRERGGRFLKRDDITGKYFDIGNKKAEAKTGQALREGLEVRATNAAAASLLKGNHKSPPRRPKKARGGKLSPTGYGAASFMAPIQESIMAEGTGPYYYQPRPVPVLMPPPAGSIDVHSMSTKDAKLFKQFSPPRTHISQLRFHQDPNDNIEEDDNFAIDLNARTFSWDFDNVEKTEI